MCTLGLCVCTLGLCVCTLGLCVCTLGLCVHMNRYVYARMIMYSPRWLTSGWLHIHMNVHMGGCKQT